jgi:hypothetical protein
MTTDLPPGPELDRRCALALGWKMPHELGRCDVCGWPLVANPINGCVIDNCSMRPHPEPRADRIASYSTNDGTQAEKLAWLSRLKRTVFFAVHPNGAADVECNAVQASGTTIQHALALLCVAVHEREKVAK